jgi:phosphate starvation-inducible PhoH-like protein
MLSNIIKMVFVTILFKRQIRTISSKKNNISANIKFIFPKNREQKLYNNMLNNNNIQILFCTGQAGTGKTLLAMNYALQQLQKSKIDKIILTRPTITVDNENLGFLPGDVSNKIKPFMSPFFDMNEKDIKKYEKNQQIVMHPLAYMRGMTFKNCIVICDEMENSTPLQMKMLLTRIGEDCKMIVLGDIAQSDIKGVNGLEHFINKLDKSLLLDSNDEDIESISSIELKVIERNPLINKILKLYDN